MIGNLTLLQRVTVYLTLILCCAIVGAGIAWIWPVYNALPNPENDVRYDQAQALRDLQEDNASRKLARAGMGAIGGCVFGIGYFLLRKHQDSSSAA